MEWDNENRAKLFAELNKQFSRSSCNLKYFQNANECSWTKLICDFELQSYVTVIRTFSFLALLDLFIWHSTTDTQKALCVYFLRRMKVVPGQIIEQLGRPHICRFGVMQLFGFAEDILCAQELANRVQRCDEKFVWTSIYLYYTLVLFLMYNRCVVK